MSWKYKVVKKYMKDGRSNDSWFQSINSDFLYYAKAYSFEYYYFDDNVRNARIFKIESKRTKGKHLIILNPAKFRSWPRFSAHLCVDNNKILWIDEKVINKKFADYIVNHDDWKLGYHPLTEY